jgi:hypothetical protein
VPRNQPPGLSGDQPVRLRVVDLAAGDRGGERLQVVRVHLVVGRHHGGDIHALLERTAVAGDDRGADAAIPLVDKDGHTLVCGGGNVRPFARRVP